MQIDVIEVDHSRNLVRCSLYTGERCVRMYISVNDYDEMIRDGFFIRNGKNRDSAGVLNTTEEYAVVKAQLF